MPCTPPYLHYIHPIRDILEFGVRPAGTLVEYECVEVVAQAERDIKGRKNEHEGRDGDERPVDTLLATGGAPKERTHAKAERHEIDTVRDSLHEERDDLRLVDGECVCHDSSVNTREYEAAQGCTAGAVSVGGLRTWRMDTAAAYTQ